MKTDNLFADIVFGIVFSSLGYYFVFYRERIVTALISSNKVFWENLGYISNEKKGIFLTNILIPSMGLVFFVVGVMLFYKATIYFLK